MNDTNIWYHKNTNIHIKSYFKNDVQEGISIEYTDDGSMCKKYLFLNGKIVKANEYINGSKSRIYRRVFVNYSDTVNIGNVFGIQFGLVGHITDSILYLYKSPKKIINNAVSFDKAYNAIEPLEGKYGFNYLPMDTGLYGFYIALYETIDSIHSIIYPYKLDFYVINDKKKYDAKYIEGLISSENLSKRDNKAN